jgi:glucose-6-phosphate 1-dehydrogenase
VIQPGKALPVRATEIRIIFKRPPRLPISTHAPDANDFILRIDPSPCTDLVIQAKTPGGENRIRTVESTTADFQKDWEKARAARNAYLEG